jgi:hypothetical protein
MKLNLAIHPLSLTTYFRMGVTMFFLVIAGTLVNELGFLIALNGMFISLVTSGHGLVLADTNSLGRLSSYSIFIFIVGIISFLVFLPLQSASVLAIYFLGSMVFAQGSISMKLCNDDKRLFILLVVSVFLKSIILFFYKYTSPFMSLVLLGLSDLIYFRNSAPKKGWYQFGISVLILALGGFINQFTGIQIRNKFLNIDFFEWIMRLIEIPAMLAWTLLLYGWNQRINYYDKKSYYYRFLLVISLCLLHLFLYKFSAIKLGFSLSLGIILYNILKIEMSVLGLQYVISRRTTFLFSVEIIYFLVVMLGLKFGLDIFGIVYLLVGFTLAALFVFYKFKNHGRD